MASVLALDGLILGMKLRQLYDEVTKAKGHLALGSSYKIYINAIELFRLQGSG